ncbi:hypothetical protein MKX03_003420 [Papaver bracteatum]|nr:hypothetical protein MKX03_003420 [Papaver bracteatum]
MDSKETQPPPSTASQPPQSTPSQPPPPQSQHPPQQSNIPQPTLTPPPEIPQNPNPNNNPQIQSSTNPLHHQQQSIHNHQSQIRAPPMNNRIRPPPPQQQQQPPQALSTSHFPSTTSSPVPNTVTSTPHLQRGGVAIGLPAHPSRPPTPSTQQQQPSHFSSFGPSSYTTQFTRNPVNVPETLTPNQMKSVHPGIQNIGMMGSISSGSIMRPPGGSMSHLQNRAVVSPQSSMRPPVPTTNQSTQKYQSHEQPHVLQRVSTTSASSPAAPAGMQPQLTQQWMSSSGPGRPMHSPTLTSTPYRQQMRPQTLSQRSHIPQQHPHSYSAVSHQMPSGPQQQQQQQQQQPSQPNQSQEHYNHQFPPTRIQQQPSPHPALGLRGLAPGSVKISTTSPSGVNNSPFSADPGETSNQILSKRSIHELITQIDPSEKVDPEVEDILVDIAEDFVESVTTFACSLAKHRKSNVLEAKDILLHLERNWNMSLPGFGGDEIKNYKKPYTDEIHRERLAAIKKSMVLSDAGAYVKSSVGAATGAAKGHTAKAAPAP